VRFLIMCTYSASGYNAFFLIQHLGVPEAGRQNAPGRAATITRV
jgi:hypothetical protein